MKLPAVNLRALLVGTDPESRALWRKYQLSVTPKFYAVLSVLLAIAAARNLAGATAAAPTLLMAALVGMTAVAGYFGKPWFPALTRLTSIGFILIILWSYLNWGTGFPPPSLILLPLAVLFVVFADHLVMASVLLLFALGLLIHAAIQVPPGAATQYELLLAFAVTTVMLYLCALLLWFLLHGLFRARAELSEALAASLTLRQSLLTIFFDKLSPPLVLLELQLKRDTVAWPEVDRILKEVLDTLGVARQITLSLGPKLDTDPGQSERELEHLRDFVQYFLLFATLVTGLAIAGAGLLGSIPLRLPETGAALVVCVLAGIALRRQPTARNRLAAIHGFVGFIALICALAIFEQRAPYQLLYFYIPVFCAVFICGSLHAVSAALAAAAVIGIWYFAFPPLDGTAAYMRSNMGLALIFLLAFSHIVWAWFRQALREISEQDNRLRRESETRQRLLATLFHDIANPLHVMHGNTEMALNGVAGTDLALLRNLATRIRALVAFTREFDEIERTGGALPVEAVQLAPVFAELQATYRGKLAAKGLELTVDTEAPAVLAHAAVLVSSVLSNLLGNAIKFSPHGGHIRIGTRTLNGGRVKIRIQDDGGGLPAGILQQALRGGRIQSTRGTAGEPGDGQGLRLAALYLSRMNGRLALDADGVIALELPLAS